MISLKSREWVIENIETVIFDKDGTFVDLHHFWGKLSELRVQYIINKYKLKQELLSLLCLKLGYNLETKKMEENGITALYSRPQIISIFCLNLQDLGIKISEHELEKIFDSVSNEFNSYIEKYIKPIPEAINFIKQLQQSNIKLGIVTSDSVEATMLTLKHLKLESTFASVIGRESCSFKKESGEPTKIALSELNANPETTIMIGDAPMDYLAAKNAGINKTILVASGQICKENLLNTSEYVLNNLSELSILI